MSVTYVFSPNTKIYSGQVNQNFTDLAAGTAMNSKAITPSKTGSFDKVRAVLGSTQLVGTGSSAAVSWTSASYDGSATADMWIAGDPTKVSIKNAGEYDIDGFASFAANNTHYRQFSLRVNGSVIVSTTVGSSADGDETGLSLSTQYRLAVSDYVQLFVFQNTGGNLNVSAGASLAVCRQPQGA